MTTGSSKTRQITMTILTVLIWLVIAALGMYEIYLLREIVFSVFSLFSREYYLAVTLGQIAVVLGALAWVVFIMASLEYHLKHAGTRKSWRLFAWTFGVELIILILAFILT